MPRRTFQPEYVTPDVVLRYLNHIRFEASGCMIWTACARNERGYLIPMMSANYGQPRSVRSIAWVIYHDTVPPRTGVTPGCGNALCVCPRHMKPFRGDPPITALSRKLGRTSRRGANHAPSSVSR